MATPQEIFQDANYRGDAALGNAGFGVIQVETKPLQDLSLYIMAKKKYDYEQKKKETDAKVAEVADISKIILNDLRGKDKDQATAEYGQLVAAAGEYARSNPKTQDEKVKTELDWQTKKRAFYDNFDSGKNRAVSYQARKNEIMQNITDASRQDAAIKQLDSEFDNTSISTKISALPNFKMESVSVPEPVKTEVSFVGVGPNDNTNVKGSIYVPANNLSSANATVLGIQKDYPKKGSPEYSKLSPNEQAQADQQATVESSGKVWTDAVEPLNEAIHQKNTDGTLVYVNSDGSFNDEKFRKDYATNTVVLNAYDGVKKLDDYSTTMQQQIGTGLYTDHNIKYKLPADLQASQFDAGIINWSRDIQPNQLVMAGSFAKDKGNEFTKTLQHTGEGNDLTKAKMTNALGWAKLGLDKDEFGLKQKQFEQSQKGSQTQINGATERAKRIYGDLVKLADEHGFVSPDKLRQLNVEQLKYLGTEQPEQKDDLGKTVVAGGFKPLDLSAGEDAKNPIQYGLVVKDGDVKVIKNPKPNEDRTKGFVYGEFDNTKSTNVFNIATNVLNEELKNAGSKELNSYWGVDVTGQPTQVTDTQTKTTKSSSFSDKSTFKANGKTYTKKQLNDLGYSDEQINQAIQLGNIKQ